MEKIKGKRVRVAAGKRKTRTATVHFRTETSVTPEQRRERLQAEVDAKAQALVAKACGWVASNPDTWAKLRRICYRLMLEGHVIQRDNVYTLACQNGMTVSEASEFKRDHNLWSVLSRYMVLQRPSMLAAVSFRRTPVDSVDLVGTWEAIVGPAVFAASTLTEAQGIYDRGVQ